MKARAPFYEFEIYRVGYTYAIFRKQLSEHEVPRGTGTKGIWSFKTVEKPRFAYGGLYLYFTHLLCKDKLEIKTCKGQKKNRFWTFIHFIIPCCLIFNLIIFYKVYFGKVLALNLNFQSIVFVSISMFSLIITLLQMVALIIIKNQLNLEGSLIGASMKQN